jgi:hypothetical protein
MSNDAEAFQNRIKELEEENARILSHKLALEWFPPLEKQTGCYDYRIATREISRAFDVFRAHLLNPLLEDNRILKKEIMNLRTKDCAKNK